MPLFSMDLKSLLLFFLSTNGFKVFLVHLSSLVFCPGQEHSSLWDLARKKKIRLCRYNDGSEGTKCYGCACLVCLLFTVMTIRPCLVAFCIYFYYNQKISNDIYRVIMSQTKILLILWCMSIAKFYSYHCL